MQDVLKIHTVNRHIICLRFYADLEDGEAHPERLATENQEDPIYKNNAFQWAQTIVRFCGPEQLKQPLPHFGDDSVDELRDFFVVRDDIRQTNERNVFGYIKNAIPRRADANNLGHRRSQTTDNLPGLLPRPKHRRSQSTDYLPGLANESRVKYRRSQSSGEVLANAIAEDGGSSSSVKYRRSQSTEEMPGNANVEDGDSSFRPSELSSRSFHYPGEYSNHGSLAASVHSASNEKQMHNKDGERVAGAASQTNKASGDDENRIDGTDGSFSFAEIVGDDYDEAPSIRKTDGSSEVAVGAAGAATKSNESDTGNFDFSLRSL